MALESGPLLCHTHLWTQSLQQQPGWSRALMACVPTESTFQLILVHPKDRGPGVEWENLCYYDIKLKFSLRSVQYTFHYLDDCIILPNSEQCRRDLDALWDICCELGVLLAVCKRKGPVTCLVLLGIKVDTITGCCICPQRYFSGKWRGRSQGTDSQPCCQCTPTTCIALLRSPNLDWVSLIWTQLFSPNSSMVWLIQHSTPTYWALYQCCVRYCV